MSTIMFSLKNERLQGLRELSERLYSPKPVCFRIWILSLGLVLLTACSAGAGGGEAPPASPGATQAAPLTTEAVPGAGPTVLPPAETLVPSADTPGTAGTEPPAPTTAGAGPVETATAGTAPGEADAELPPLVCAAPAEPSPAMTEGPYYKPDSPERASLLEPGTVGTPLILTGLVLTTDCQPIPGAWLDFWQTDGAGEYDNAGFGLRGHQFTDDQGRYRLETVLPGLYPGRTAHIHVKVQAPGGPVLTTQIFFPGEPQNETDRIFSPQLLADLQEGEDGSLGRFNFVLP